MRPHTARSVHPKIAAWMIASAAALVACSSSPQDLCRDQCDAAIEYCQTVGSDAEPSTEIECTAKPAPCATAENTCACVLDHATCGATQCDELGDGLVMITCPAG